MEYFEYFDQTVTFCVYFCLRIRKMDNESLVKGEGSYANWENAKRSVMNLYCRTLSPRRRWKARRRRLCCVELTIASSIDNSVSGIEWPTATLNSPPSWGVRLSIVWRTVSMSGTLWINESFITHSSITWRHDAHNFLEVPSGPLEVTKQKNKFYINPIICFILHSFWTLCEYFRAHSSDLSLSVNSFLKAMNG